MTQKFGLDSDKPAEEQIRRTEFNLAKGRVYIYKHYNSGRITTGSETYIRDELIGGDAKVGGDMNDKDAQESQKAQTNKRILEMERRCHEQIKEQEKGALAETNWKLEFEKNI